MGTVYFLRHGQSQANLDRINAGQSESPLTARGRQEAIVAAQDIVSQRLTFDVMLSSPIGRARDTAVIIASSIGYKKPIIYLDDLKERFCGDFQGATIAEYQAADEATSIKNSHVESVGALLGRAKRVKKLVETDYADQRVLIVSHSGFGNMLRHVFRDEPAASYQKADQLPNATLLRFN